MPDASTPLRARARGRFAGAMAVTALLLAGAASAAETVALHVAGVACGPATPADAERISRIDGKLTASAPAVVACALAPVPPGHHQVHADVYLFDARRRWGNYCRFHETRSPNPATGALYTKLVLARALSSGSTALAGFERPAGAPEVQAVVCNLLRGQSLLVVDNAVAPD